MSMKKLMEEHANKDNIGTIVSKITNEGGEIMIDTEMLGVTSTQVRALVVSLIINTAEAEGTHPIMITSEVGANVISNLKRKGGFDEK